MDSFTFHLRRMARSVARLWNSPAAIVNFAALLALAVLVWGLLAMQLADNCTYFIGLCE